MKPIKFKESNRVLMGKRPILPLHVYSDGEIIMSCWKMSLRERVIALLYGRIWLQVNAKITHSPVVLFCGKKGFK